VLTVVVRATGSLVAGIFGMAAMSAAVTLGYDFRTARLILPGRRQANDRTTQYSKPNVFRPYWDIRALRSLLWIGIPMGLVLGLNALSGAVPRYVIASRLGTSQLGVFAAMIYLVVAAQQVTGALSDSATARLARLSAEGERRAFRLLVLKLVAATLIVGALGVLIAVVAGREILTILYRPQYGRSADTLIWVMAGLAPLLTAQVLGTATTAMRRFYVQVPFRVFQFGATWVLCTLLASEGLVGIGKAFFFASSLFALSDVILVIACERRLKQRMVVVGPMLARGS
jgi:O-antigen/teichoic acid export membrane protein